MLDIKPQQNRNPQHPQKLENYPLDGGKQKRPPLCGSDKDIIWIADDFDEPLEEFEDYKSSKPQD